MLWVVWVSNYPPTFLSLGILVWLVVRSIASSVTVWRREALIHIKKVDKVQYSTLGTLGTLYYSVELQSKRR